MAEIRQLQRRLNERVLKRAEADLQWRQQFIEDQEAAMSDIPEARQIRETYQGARVTEQPTEATVPPAREEYRQVKQGLLEKLLDRAASDPEWKQRLLDDPQAAVREANLPEAQRFEEMLQKEEAEVRGQGVLGDRGADIRGDGNIPEDYCHWCYTAYWPYYTYRY